MSEDTKGFTVKDRRHAAETQATQTSGSKEGQTAAKQKTAPSSTALPKIDFATFIFSLNSSALVHLGLLEDPGTQEKSKNLPLAKQTIDILGMLQEKTKGNLTLNEEQMLKNMLYDLRILYVKETQ